MTIEKCKRFQLDLKQLFKSYGISSGVALFIHDNTLHPIEAHVTEKNEFVVSLMNALSEASKAAGDIPVKEYWSTDEN